jgi:hypothetical protein
MYFPLLADPGVICEFCKFDGLPIISSTIALASFSAADSNTFTISHFSDDRIIFGLKRNKDAHLRTSNEL